MAKLTSDDLLKAIEEMSVLELKEFLDAFEEKFDVTAAAPAAPAAPVAGSDDAPEEKDSFDVVLTAAGDQKIQVIKAVRGLTSLGLKEAKEMVDGVPSEILKGASKEDAEKAREALEGAGATVDLK
jgi:large subunit ribosomal protein L7/L12